MQEQIRETRNSVYRYVLFLMLGVTRALSALDFHIPTKWWTLLDSVRTSSDVLHDRIATIDTEVEEDFREREEMLERRFGNKKFYSEEEIEELQNRIHEMQV